MQMKARVRACARVHGPGGAAPTRRADTARADSARARKLGRRPGGMIMVHGRPNEPKRSPRYYDSEDWTDGCIASQEGLFFEAFFFQAEDGIRAHSR